MHTQLMFTTSLPLNSETDQEVSGFSGNDEGLVELLLPVPQVVMIQERVKHLLVPHSVQYHHN